MLSTSVLVVLEYEYRWLLRATWRDNEWVLGFGWIDDVVETVLLRPRAGGKMQLEVTGAPRELVSLAGSCTFHPLNRFRSCLREAPLSGGPTKEGALNPFFFSLGLEPILNSPTTCQLGRPGRHWPCVSAIWLVVHYMDACIVIRLPHASIGPNSVADWKWSRPGRN